MAEEGSKKSCKWCELGECWGCAKNRKGGGKGGRKGGKGGKGKGGGGGGGAKGVMSPMALFQHMKQLVGQGGGAGGCGGGGGADAGEGDTNWKQELGVAWSKSRKTPILKDAYATVAVDGTKNQYQSTVTLEGVTHQGEAATGKKKAEQEAAKVAFQALFPGEEPTGYGAAQSNQDEFWQQAFSMMQQATQTTGGKKQKGAVAEAPAALHPKSRLLHGLALVYGRALTKADFNVDITGDVGKYQATITFKEGNLSFNGETGDSKKTAEASCCEAALEGLKPQLEAAMAEHQAKKNIKNAESLQKLKDSRAAKKAANDAAKAAAGTA